MNTLTLVTPPAQEPLSLAEAKTFLRISDSSQDELIATLISAVRQAAELYCGRAFLNQTYRYRLDEFPCAPFSLPRPPLLSVLAVLLYQGEAATLLDPAQYRVQGQQLYLETGSYVISALEVEYSAGYGSLAADVPAALKQGMLLHMLHLYNERGETPSRTAWPPAILALYAPYRVISCP